MTFWPVIITISDEDCNVDNLGFLLLNEHELVGCYTYLPQAYILDSVKVWQMFKIVSNSTVKIL